MNDTSPIDLHAGVEEIAAELDALEHVPDDVLLKIVTRDGSCMHMSGLNHEPEWLCDELTDRQMAARICAGCPVQRHCLEVQLRTAGAATMGVWGALAAQDARALFPVWRSRRGGSPTSRDARGGERA